MLVSQVEEVQAANTLTQELKQDDDEAAYYYKNFHSLSSSDNDDNCSLVTQLEWEKDVLWDTSSTIGEDPSSYRVKLMERRCGWIPSQSNRTAPSSSTPDEFKSLLSYENEELAEGSWESEVIWDAVDFKGQFPQPKLPVFDATDEDIVFEMPKDVPPKETSDSQQLVSFGGSSSSKRAIVVQPHTLKSKLILGKTGFIPWGNWKKERLEAKKLAKIHNQEQSPSIWISNLNISNDQYYLPKDSLLNTSNLSISNFRHSRLIKEFISPFIQTHLTVEHLRNFHRPKLTAFDNPTLHSDAVKGYFITSLAKRIRLKAVQRARQLAQGLPIIFDQPIDLSGRDGEIILLENSEEFPPLLSQVGMCSEIVNYYKRRSLKEDKYEPSRDHPFGELSYVSGSTSSFPFLGTLEGGRVLTAIRNNLYRAPIYWHEVPVTDFLVIRSKNSGYMIRDLNGLFVAGQQCPLVEVPEPNSAKVKNFLKDFLQVFVYRRYKSCLPPEEESSLASKPSSSCKTTPRIKMDEIAQHFPTLAEVTIRSMLKNSSELQRIRNTTWMVMKSGFPLPSEEELSEMINPEQVCAYYSLLATEQRFRDAGLDTMLSLPERGQDEVIGLDGGKKGRKSKSLLDAVTDNNKGHGGKGKSQQKQQQQQQQQHSQSALDEELLSAPWNTTSAFVTASKGKCLLQVTGPADPTGCGEGFSYVRVTKKGTSMHLGPVDSQAATQQHSGRGRPRKLPLKTGGTDADLRKLSAKSAKEYLRKAGVPNKEIDKLSRWEIIDLLRTLSTEKVMQGELNDQGMTKFCRWKSIHSQTMNQERYRESCQRTFDLQNKVLSSKEILSSEEEGDSEDDEHGRGEGRHGTFRRDIENMGKNIERILNGDVDVEKMSHEEEELERLELQKMMLGGIRAKDQDIARRKEALERERELAKKSKANSEDILTSLMKNPGRVLKISRTFREEGENFVRTEIVRDPVVIAAYLRIRNSKTEDFIKKFLYHAERREKKEQKLKDRMLLSQLKDQADMEMGKVQRQQRKRKREMDDQYFPNMETKRKAEKMLRRQARKCGGCGMPGHMKTSKECPLYNQEKIDQMIKKRDEKKSRKLKKVVGGPPVKNTNIDPLLIANDLKISSSEESEDDDTDSSSSSSASGDDQQSSSEEGEKGRMNISYSSVEDGGECTGEWQPEPIVKTDGLKMLIKTSSIQQSIYQAQEQEAKEQEVAAILAAMAMESEAINLGGASGVGSISRRRISQAERENADYLSDRKYKTTAADRRSARL